MSKLERKGSRWCLTLNDDELEAIAVLLEDGAEDILAEEGLAAARNVRQMLRRSPLLDVED